MGKQEEIQANTVTPGTSIHDGQTIEIHKTKPAHADVALDFVEKHEGVVYTEEQEKAVLRKIDRYQMPLKDLNLKGQDYSWCPSMFYLGYMAFQPFAAIILTYFPMGKFVSATSLAWAIVLLCTPGAKDFSGMAACRFFLGIAEGGISPAYVLLTGTWYKKDEIPLRMTIWFCGNGVAIILQSLISYGIGHIDHTGIAVWRWFFIIFGIAGLFWSAVLFWFMPDTMLTAKFLDEEEKAIAVERIRRNRTGIANPEFKKNQFIEAILDPKVWWTLVFTIVWIIPTTAVASFGSLVINGFGYGTFESSLLNMPLGLTEIIGLLGAGLVTSYYPNMRCIMQVICNTPAAIGAGLVYSLPKSNKVGRLIAFYCTNFTNGTLPMLWAMTNSNVAGHTKRTTSTAFMFLGYSAGFVIGPQFFLGSEAPIYPTGFKTMMICFSISCILPLFYYTYITWLNNKRARKLEESGEASVVLRNEEFYDLTDKEQLHFVYIK